MWAFFARTGNLKEKKSMFSLISPGFMEGRQTHKNCVYSRRFTWCSDTCVYLRRLTWCMRALCSTGFTVSRPGYAGAVRSRSETASLCSRYQHVREPEQGRGTAFLPEKAWLHIITLFTTESKEKTQRYGAGETSANYIRIFQRMK